MTDMIELFGEYISPEPNSGCWLCESRNNQRGYARVSLNRRKVAAHRLSYELSRGGPIPDGFEIDHLCGVSCCVNPLHLEAVTPFENKRRAARARERNMGFKCPNGHDRTPDNIYVKPNGSRMCRKCRAISRARYNNRSAAKGGA